MSVLKRNLFNNWVNYYWVIKMNKIYLCIDLKTFYASVECVERNLDPFKVNLVVADPSRGKGALCLAISPRMKELGVKNRCRLFEIPKGMEYVVAIPRMKLYMEYSANIYEIYLKYISSNDIHVYSIDEVFLDVTNYLSLYQMSAKELAKVIIDDIFKTTGICATVGVGTNLYLSKIALDIVAKHSQDNMGILNEQSYQKYLWHYQPLTDFWQVGRGIAKRLAKYQIYDMHGITKIDENILYKEFGINAQYLIDHAYGREPTTISEIKQYKSKSNSMSHSQVLFEDYSYQDALLVVKEMVELKVLDLVEQHLVTNHIALSIGYSKQVIKATGGSRKIGVTTNSYQILLEEFINLFKQTTNPNYLIRQISISFGNVIDEMYEAYNLFTDYEALQEERQLQKALIEIKNKYGKNAVLKGMNLLDKATTPKRNKLIGGHNSE